MTNITGTNAVDLLHGTGADDIIDGLDGGDTLYGGDGNDLLNGGSETDTLDGEAGNDTLNGGDGDDILEDTYGTNTFNGDAGNDNIFIYGGDGTINAGTGNDLVWLYQTAYDASHVFTVDLGADDDTFQFKDVTGLTITGGDGRDTYVPILEYHNTAGTIITDFKGGPDGDIIKVDDLLAATDYRGENPFGNGYLSLVQSGNDVLLQLKGDTIIILQDVHLSDLTADNFGGLPADGSALANTAITGTGYDDTITGTGGNDTIDGVSGADTIFGSLGNDVINGGGGNDTINGGLGDDILSGGDGDDSLYDPYGANQFYGGNGNDVISAYSGSSVDAGSGNDRVSVLVGDVTVKLGDGEDTMFFYAVNDLVITGGSGRDTYDPAQVFSGSTNITITDFQGALPVICLSWMTCFRPNIMPAPIRLPRAS
ncbi:MAG: hypothetical protein NVV72_12130 [Asticcacaulis sp.]|nr:hypothetical protein [Asticcacaulis sp.]